MLHSELPAYAITIFVGVSLTSLNTGLQLFLHNEIYRTIYNTSIFIGTIFVISLLASFWYIISEDIFYKEFSILFAFVGSTGLLYFLFLLFGTDRAKSILKDDFLPKI